MHATKSIAFKKKVITILQFNKIQNKNSLNLKKKWRKKQIKICNSEPNQNQTDQQRKFNSNYEINRGKIRLSKPLSLMQQLFLQNTCVVLGKKLGIQQNDRVRSFKKL